ncbi:MAG: acetyltransferase [Nitrososphaeria archaeon]
MIYIVGAGGFAREVHNILIDLGLDDEVIGFLEDNCQRRGALLHGKKIDDTSILQNLDPNRVKLVCGIGSPLRKKLIERTKKMGFSYMTLIHPSVIKSKWVEFGEGAVVCAGNVFTSEGIIGDFSIIYPNCTITHDVVVGKYTTIASGTHISGNVTIGNECFIGTGTVFVEKVRVGDRVFIGAGSVVTKDIPDGVLAYGVPAKVVRKLSEDEWLKLI